MDREMQVRGSAQELDLPNRWENNLKVAKEILSTGLLPKTISTPQQVVLIMETGREIGIPPIEALRSVFVVDGKPALSSQLMLSLIHRSGVLEDMKIEDGAGYCTVTMKRKGQTPYTVTFGQKDAQSANLLYKDNWKKYPSNMYRARAISMCARVVAPDVIAGLYTPEELEEGIDTMDVTTSVQKAEALTDDSQYNAFKNDIIGKIEAALEVCTQNSHIIAIQKGYSKEIATLREADRKEILSKIDVKTRLLTSDGDIQAETEGEEQGYLDTYKHYASQTHTVEELKAWYLKNKDEIIKNLTKEEQANFLNFCKDLKNNMENESTLLAGNLCDKILASKTIEELDAAIAEKNIAAEKNQITQEQVDWLNTSVVTARETINAPKENNLLKKGKK